MKKTVRKIKTFSFRMATVHAIERGPLSLANYAFRAVIKNEITDDNNILIEPILAEYNKLKTFEGNYFVRALEFRIENYFCEHNCIPSDKYTFNAMNRVKSPDVGDEVIISRSGVNFNIRGSFCNSLNLDIDWTDASWNSRGSFRGTYFHSSPDIYQSIYFEHGKIRVDQWYNWHNRLGSFSSTPKITELYEVGSVWEVGKEQSLSINSAKELIWICSQLHTYDSNLTLFPPLLKSTWVCKASKICTCAPGCTCS